MELYKADAVCRTCRISARQLGYWISSEIISPTAYIESFRKGKRLFLFSFNDLVRIRLVRELRLSGFTLKSIRTAIDAVRDEDGQWEARWLVTDGRGLYRATADATVLEQVTGQQRGQLAFAAVALGEASRAVEIELKRRRCRPVEISSFKGHLRDWDLSEAGS